MALFRHDLIGERCSAELEQSELAGALRRPTQERVRLPGSDSPGSDSPGSDSPGSDSPGSDSEPPLERWLYGRGG